MNPERKVAVVTDSGSSMRPEYDQVKKYKVTIVPLEIKFYENGQYVPYSDLEINPQDFYQRMRTSAELPQTSGAVTSKIAEIYKTLSRETKSIISIHLTSKHSAVWQSAVLGKSYAQEEIPKLLIEVIDSRQLSLGTWFLVEQAAGLAQEGATLEEIKREVLVSIPKIGLVTTISSLENIIKGGRVPALAGYLGMLLDIKPILGIVDGEVREVGKVRTIGKARKEMINRIKGEEKEIVKMAILHTNEPQGAEEVRQALREFYFQEIPIYEAGPVLGVHAGEGAVGVAFQKA